MNKKTFEFQSFESPLFLASSMIDRSPKSPPPEQIIKSSNLHPRTMGQFDSTKKLCYAPNIKTMQCKRKSVHEDKDVISDDPIYFRFLRLLTKYEIPIQKHETGKDISLIVNGMLTSLCSLNKMFLISPKFDMKDDKITFNESNKGDINVLNYYNSFSSQVSFAKSIEINKSKSSISFRVKHRFDSKWYFLKMGMHHNMSNELKSLNRSNLDILNEIKILALASHPNIIRYFTSWFEQRIFFIQLEYLAGESLYYFLYASNRSKENEFKMIPRTNKISELTAIEIITQIGSALHYLHEDLNVVHNDVQPCHIMIFHDKFDLPMKSDNVDSVRSMIYQCMLRNSVPQNIKFKLISFGYSFNINDKPLSHKSNYMPDWTVDTPSRDYWIRRDIFALAMTVIHAICGANYFCPEKIKKSRCQGLDIRDDSLRAMLTDMMENLQ